MQPTELNRLNILETIIAAKRVEVEQRSKALPVSLLRQSEHYERARLSLRQRLPDETGTGIIAEFKRRSPSKGSINETADVVEVTRAYAESGAAGLSILTDELFFGGSTADLVRARINQVPILRKDFIIDPYQLEEAKSMGADVVLLIAACLTPGEVQDLAGYAKELGLEVLLELHAEEELGHICDATELVGINNRNLKTFAVDLEHSLRMARAIPDSKIKIAESGIGNVETIRLFRENGFRGFLVGEHFMKTSNPGAAFAEFVRQLHTVSGNNLKQQS